MHAFAVIGYTEEGFIVQNSWGEEWVGLDIADSRFDSDEAIMNALLELILGDEPSQPFNPDDLADY